MMCVLADLEICSLGISTKCRAAVSFDTEKDGALTAPTRGYYMMVTILLLRLTILITVDGHMNPSAMAVLIPADGHITPCGWLFNFLWLDALLIHGDALTDI